MAGQSVIGIIFCYAALFSKPEQVLFFQWLGLLKLYSGEWLSLGTQYSFPPAVFLGIENPNSWLLVYMKIIHTQSLYVIKYIQYIQYKYILFKFPLWELALYSGLYIVNRVRKKRFYTKHHHKSENVFYLYRLFEKMGKLWGGKCFSTWEGKYGGVHNN